MKPNPEYKEYADGELKDLLARARDTHNLMTVETSFDRREKRAMATKVKAIITELKHRGHLSP